MIGIVLAIRNTRLSAVLTAIDAGTGAGRLLLYKGTRPATGSAPGAGDQLASLALADPAGSIASGVLTFSAVSDQTADAGGLPTWARFVDSDLSPVLDGDIGIPGSGDLVTMEEDSGNPGQVKPLYAGGLVVVSSAQLTEGNP